MSCRGVGFFWEWIETKVLYSGVHNDIVVAGKLARKLIADATRAGYSLEAMGFGESSVATMIMKALAMTPYDRPIKHKSGHPFFPT